MPRERKGSIVTKDGKLYARVRFKDANGKQRDIWKKVRSRGEARGIIHQILREIEALTPQELDAANMTFADLAKHYLEHYIQPAAYVGDRKVFGVRSLVTPKVVIKPLVEHFGSRKLKSITYGQIRSYKQMRLNTPTRQGGQRSIATINRELGQLRRMLRIAVREHWMPRNVFSEGDALISLNDENQRKRILSRAEEVRLLASIDSQPQRAHIKGMVLIALDCSLRRGELFTLKWSDVSLQNRTITVQAFNAKTAKSRTVAMTMRVYEWLLHWRENVINEPTLVFNIKVTIKTAWTKICREAGIEDFHFQPGLIAAAYNSFHSYSIGNQLLAMVQCQHRGITPGPIATFPAWKEKGRHVKKGEKALTLCMPMTRKNEDDETFTSFIYRNRWFVLSQTEGQEIEQPVPPAWDKARALAELSITEIEFDHTDGNVMGYAKKRCIAISPLAFAPYKTLFHELAHVTLGHTEELDFSDSESTPKSLREVEAESVALILCESLNLPGADYARGYIQSYLSGDVIPEKSAQKIFRAADRILKAGAPVTVAEAA